MKSNLNSGDKVFCVDNTDAIGGIMNSLQLNKIYEVSTVFTPQAPLCFTLKEFGDSILWSAERFVKVGEETLSINGYQAHALRTASGSIRSDCFDAFDLVLNGALGLAGEAGEVVDLIKKYLYQGHTLDKEKLADELGDVCWYVAVLANGLGYNLEDIMQGNVEKLLKRYPNGFEAERSISRED